MAESGTAKRKTTKKLSAEQIVEAYKTFTLENGHPPSSVFIFTKELGYREDAFYEHFGSFDAVQKHVWSDYITHTIHSLHSDETYAEYSTREKLLSFYFTLIETLTKDRSFVQHSLSPDLKSMKELSAFTPVRDRFIEYIQELIAEGFESGEIEHRKVISDRYKDGLWLQLLFIISFWLKDDSARFTKTDAAIEKSVNLSYDLMGSGPLDRIVDLTKFIWQNR